MVWSFSRLNSYYNCPYEWYQNYINYEEKRDNAMAQFGSFIHKILELYAKKELSIFQLSDYYIDHFDENITEFFPPNKYIDMREKYYQAGLNYLDNIDLKLEKYDILGVEKRVDFEIEGYKFVGYIDLLLKNKQTNQIIILDHKSANITFLKDGSISKKDRNHFEDFKRQLYLYSKPVFEQYGYVDVLKWNLFKTQNFIEIPWIWSEYNEAEKWALNTIELIKKESDWGINPELIKAQIDGKYPPFYCMNLCSMRSKCENKNEYLQSLKGSREECEV